MDTGNRQGSFIRSRFARVAMLGLLAASAWSCGRSPLGTLQEGESASVVLELREAPADVACLVVTIATTREEKRRLDVPADGPVTFLLRRLPVGRVVFSAEAHPATCAALAEGAEASWVGGPVSAVLRAGLNDTIAIQMVPAVRAGVSIQFDAGSGQTCAPVGAACAATPDCCPVSTCVFGAEGIGRCQLATGSDAGAAPDVTPDTAPAAPGVSVLLTGGQYYIVYPASGGADCQRTRGTIYTARVGASDDRCIPIGMGGFVPIPLSTLQVCTPGAGCVPCTADSCLPRSCFDELPLPPLLPPGIPRCVATLPRPTGPDPITYMLIQDMADSRPRMPAREGLPMVLAPTQTGTPGAGQGNLVITPPPGYGPIVIGNLIPTPGSGGESCDANSMCGVLPLWGVSQYSFTSWSVAPQFGSSFGFWSF